ncbi:MAG: O-antigen ligase family protein [Solirubrobacterales bacterium]|nr:O-antigen ligase family protein [Solirubrobacterales bacterium]
MTAADAQLKRNPQNELSPLFAALTTAALLAFAALFIGVQSGGVRGGIAAVLAVLVATAAFGRSAYNGTLPQPFNASLGLILMALFAGVTALSVEWSLVPNASLIDAIRLISYTCVLALAALAAQLHQDRAREILLGAGLAALLIVLYALLSRAVPGLFPDSDSYARLRLPFGYWNAVGSVSAIGLLIALWTGTNRHVSKRLEIISFPAGGLFVVALMLSQSRGALLALALVLGAWLLLIPRRLRTAGWLAIVGVASLVVVAWAYNKTALSIDDAPFAERKSTGFQLTIALIVLSGILAGAGALVHSRRRSHPLLAQQRWKIGRILLILLAISPFATVVGVGVGTEQGFSTISDGATGFFSTGTTAPSNSPDRLTETSSLRGRYWSDAYKVFESHTKRGTGGDTYAVARLPYRTDQTNAAHAHGMVPQVASDLGAIGLLVLFGLTAVWLLAAFKIAGACLRAPWLWLREADETRLASVGLMLVALLFGLHSAIDWVWFIPGVAFFGLLGGGWTLGSPAAHSSVAEPATEPSRGRRLQIVRAAAIALVGISIAYGIYQPVRAERKIAAGYAVVENDPAKALKLGNDAIRLDPTSADAFILVSVAQSNGGRQQAAEATLAELSAQQPGNPETWLRLSQFRLVTLDDPDGAIRALRPVFFQSPNNVQAANLLATARQAKADALLEKLAAKKRKQLEKELEKLEKLQKQAAASAAVDPPPAT